MNEPTTPKATAGKDPHPPPADPGKAPQGDYDGPWKAVVQAYLRPFLAFYFPRVEEAVDWTYEPRSLNTDFQGSTPRTKPSSDEEDDKTPPTDVRVDLLFEVRLLNGERRTLLLHVEVQGEYEADFAMRMFGYSGWAFARHWLPVISLAVLGDVDRPKWRPTEYGWDLPESRLEMTFGVAKLLEYNERWAELEASDNPFALVTMAHLKAKQTRGLGKVEERTLWKDHLLALLARKEWSQDDIRKLFAFIDRVMTLPTGINEDVKARYRRRKEENMELMSTWEEEKLKLGLKQGLEKGLKKGREEGQRLGQMKMLQRQMTRLYGALPAWTVERLQRGTVEQLERWDDRLFDAKTLEEIFVDE